MMKFRNDVERMIYAAAYARRHEDRIGAGYPHAWRVADQDAGVPEGSAGRLAEWEEWCADCAVSDAETAVDMHRDAMRRRKS